MFERGPFRVSVRVSSRHIEVVEHLGFIDKMRCRLRQFGDELRHRMPPGFLTEREMEGFDRLLCGLLRGKAAPLVAAVPL